MKFEQIESRLASFSDIERQRALTADERAQLHNLVDRRHKQLSRVLDQIAATEAKLARLRAIADGKVTA